MSLNATTVTGAIGAADTSFAVGAVTGVSNPITTTGGGYTLAICEQELMFVVGVNTTTLVVNVLRGQGGTAAVAHGASAPIVFGLPSDFAGYRPTTNAFQVAPSTSLSPSAPVASAATITATGPVFHLTGSGASPTTLIPYAGFIDGGTIRIIFDGSGTALTWATGGTSPYAFILGGTLAAAGTYVDFYYDAKTPGWYASRVA